MIMNGLMYNTVEHRFQAMKAVTMEDHEFVRLSASPAEAKRRGRQIKCRSDWEEVKLAVMRETLLKKFKKQTLRKKLLETGTQFLVESNSWHDNFWGECSCPKCDSYTKWNMLGLLLMSIRADIAMETARQARKSKKQ